MARICLQNYMLSMNNMFWTAPIHFVYIIVLIRVAQGTLLRIYACRFLHVYRLPYGYTRSYIKREQGAIAPLSDAVRYRGRRRGLQPIHKCNYLLISVFFFPCVRAFRFLNSASSCQFFIWSYLPMIRIYTAGGFVVYIGYKRRVAGSESLVLEWMHVCYRAS